MRDNGSASSAVLMSSIRSKDGTPIAYERSGEGPPVILVDGFVFHRNYGNIRLLAAAIAKRGFTVFSYDRRGRGESGDTEPYDVAREVEDLAIITRLAHGPVHIVGTSTGVSLALEAVRSGLNVASVALYDAHFLVDDSRPPVSKQFQKKLDELIANSQLEEAMLHYVTDHLLLPQARVPELTRSEAWPQSVAGASLLGREVALFADQFRGKPLPKTRWSKVKAPALVLTGAASPKWMRTAAKALAKVLPNAKFRLLGSQDHMSKPDRLGRALASFFSKVDTRGLPGVHVNIS